MKILTKISLSSKNKVLSLGASLLALANVLSCAGVANAATFNFSFSNGDGPVAGTVSGTIELPDGDGTFAATAVTVTSAPAVLRYTLPIDVLTGAIRIPVNTFTVIDGVIDPSVSSFASEFFLGSGFGLNGVLFGLGSQLNISGSFDLANGVLDVDNSTVTFSSANVTTPESSIFLGLLTVGSLSILTRKHKR